MSIILSSTPELWVRGGNTGVVFHQRGLDSTTNYPQSKLLHQVSMEERYALSVLGRLHL